MKTSHPVPSQNSDGPAMEPLRETLAEAIRFWEPRRLLYNIVLAAVVLVWLFATWPHFRPMFIPSSFLLLGVLASIANVCYCAAYLGDVSLQGLHLNVVRCRLRWGLWFAGTLFAILLANYWIADEVYPFVH